MSHSETIEEEAGGGVAELFAELGRLEAEHAMHTGQGGPEPA